MSDGVYDLIPTLADTNPARFARPPNNGQFQLGNSLGRGRPRGARQKLEEAFLLAVQQDFHKHGPAAIVKVRKKDPVAYVKMIASLMPKSLNLTAKVEKLANELTEDELTAMVIDVEVEPSPLIESD
jgi:hypothetical protein